MAPVHAKKRQATVREVDQTKFVKNYAALLKKQGRIEVPSWVDIVKTGPHKELSPDDEDWFYLRCAAVARHLYFERKGCGQLAYKFGGPKRNGVAPNHFTRASRGIIRRCLQSLEKIGVCEVIATAKGGRRLTKEGRKALDEVATQILHGITV
ncbi:hypothetical protein ACOME3_006837 [Neoechinorhynchus agilis]